MDTLEFYGGVNEIGGNKIKLNLDSTSLLLDFGMSFSQAGKYFAEFMNPRKGNGLGDYIEMGLLPDLKGIYREDYLKHKNKDKYEKRAVDGLLLSHAHADHADYIGFLRHDIPLYMSAMSKIILEVIDCTGSGSKEILSYKPTFEYYINKNGEFSDRKYKKEKPIERDNINILKPYTSETINNLKVQLAPVDHSLPGAAAYLIEGEEGKVVYTGDLRFHGRNKEATEEFVKRAKEFQPDILICEGTRIDSEIYKEEVCPKCGQILPKKTQEWNGPYFETEEDIEKAVYDLITPKGADMGFKGLVIVNFPIRDLDRLITFHNIAKYTERTLLISLKQAYMLYKIEKECKEKTIYPSLKDEHIGIYIPRKGNGVYPPDTFALFVDKWRLSEEEIAMKEYDNWEKKFFKCPNTANSIDVKENEGQYILRLDNFSFMELIDIKPKDAIYIHSVTEPFNEEMELSYEITKNWLNHFNIPINKPFHVSGHARGPELLDMIREINPDVLYPIHTTNIELFDVLNGDIKVVHPQMKL